MTGGSRLFIAMVQGNVIQAPTSLIYLGSKFQILVVYIALCINTLYRIYYYCAERIKIEMSETFWMAIAAGLGLRSLLAYIYGRENNK